MSPKPTEHTESNRKHRKVIWWAGPMVALVGVLAAAAALHPKAPTRFIGAGGITFPHAGTEPMWWLDTTIIAPTPKDPAIDIVVPGDALFASDSADITSDTRASLSATIRQHTNSAHVTGGTVRCYTDSTGSAQYNLDLSRRRADSVLAALHDVGLDTSRLETQGLGEADPIAENTTETGRAQNRRCEIRLNVTA